MSIEKDALERWQAEKSVYQAWGELLTSRVLNVLQSQGIELDTFLKVPAKPRLKADDSYLAKVRRKVAKGEDLDSIDDRVGVRFVVLLTEQISIVEQVILGFDYCVSKDRDYEAERDSKPLEFAYQSVHLVVRPTIDVTHGNLVVPAGVACEVQIRTLLQHAHSELTHDRLYKSRREPPRGLHRSVARSMALIEATDDIFGDVARRLDEAEFRVRSVVEVLDKIYKDAVHAEPGATNYNSEFIEELMERGFDDDSTAVRERVELMMASKPYLAEKISENRERQPLLYGISGVLYAYALALDALSNLRQSWPLDERYLEDICLDLGISFE